MVNTILEYLKLHILTLEQDLEDARDWVELPDNEHFESDDYYFGAIHATQHIYDYVKGIVDESQN